MSGRWLDGQARVAPLHLLVALLLPVLVSGVLTAPPVEASPAVTPEAAAVAATPTQQACSGQAYVRKRLASGTTWELCWRVDAMRGLVLAAVAVQGPRDVAPRLVLDSVATVSMDVPYDVGTTAFDDVLEFGFGTYLAPMTAAECPSGEIRSTPATDTGTDGSSSGGSRPAVCLREVGTGLAYRSQQARPGVLTTGQGSALQVTMESAVGNYEYETRYTLGDTGQIDAQVGATGEIAPGIWADRIAGLSPADEYGWPVGTGEEDYASSHYHSAVWRVDFGIDGRSDQRAAQLDTSWTKQRGPQSAKLRTARTPISSEALLNDAKRRAWWVYSPGSRNADGHPRGYEVVLGEQDTYEPTPHLRNALSLTNARACEQMPFRNRTSPCTGASIVDYANGEALTDPVAWVNVGFHHVVRDEDQTPMPTHWQGFTLRPRDFWAQSPLTPAALASRNGRLPGAVDRDDPTGQATTTTLRLDRTRIGSAERPVATVTVADRFRANGVLTFTDGVREIAEDVITYRQDGTTTVTLPRLAPGRHQLRVRFEGADNAAPSASAPVTLVVSDRAASATRARLSDSSVRRTARARLTVRVSGPSTATGRVAVRDGGRTIATTTLRASQGGRVTLALPRLGRGSHRITAAYAGNSRLDGSASSPVVLRVR